MKNKGFSMVELIIVIAIMAILAGALAPALIKYINKSRVSTDISNGQQIASAIQTAMSNEQAYDDANDATTEDYATYYGAQGASMKAELDSILGSGSASNLKTKAKKDKNNTVQNPQVFYVTVDVKNNHVTVYAGTDDASHTVYPSVGACWSY